MHLSTSSTILVFAAIAAGFTGLCIPTAEAGHVINIDMYGPLYSGVGVAPDTGTTWNAAITNGTTGLLQDSSGDPTSVTFSTTLESQFGNERPNNLMNSYLFTNFETRNFTISGLSANGTYDLYFYSGINNTGTAFTAEGQSLILTGTEALSASFVAEDWGKLTVTANGSGVIAGTVANSGGQFSAFNGLQIVFVSAPALGPAFSVTITPNAQNLGSYNFSWNTQINKLYDLVSSTDLATAPSTWDVWMGNFNLVGTGGTYNLTNIDGGANTKRFFAVRQKTPTP